MPENDAVVRIFAPDCVAVGSVEVAFDADEGDEVDADVLDDIGVVKVSV